MMGWNWVWRRDARGVDRDAPSVRLYVYVVLVLVLAGCRGLNVPLPPVPTVVTLAAPTWTDEPGPPERPTALPPTREPTQKPTPEPLASLAPANPLPPTVTALPARATASGPTLGGASAGDAYAPELGNTGYDVQQYSLALQLSPWVDEVEAVVTVDALSLWDGLAGISLDFIGFEVERVTVDGGEVTTERRGGKLMVGFAEPLAAGQAFQVVIAYRGSPVYERSRYVPFIPNLGLQYRENSLFVLAEPDGARYWFPCNDHPTDKAFFRFELTVPGSLSGVANGLLVETRANADRTKTFTWEHRRPMATYLATVAVGDYVLIEETTPGGIPMRSYIFPDLVDDYNRVSFYAQNSLDWMAETFGGYPFETFGFVTVRQVRASLETQTLVVLSELMMNQETVIHEVIHMWFGDWVSMASWADMWHNEGFAVYLTREWAHRNDRPSLDEAMAEMESRYFANPDPDPLGALPPERMFSTASYQKGALLAHALREQVGDAAFFAGLNLYFAEFGRGHASREDFIRVMEQASGQDLEAFFGLWLGEG